MRQLLTNKKFVFTALTIIMMVFGYRLFTTNYTPLKCTLAEYEQSNAAPDAHDYYVLSGGRTTGDAYYVISSITKSVKQFVYPVISKEMLDEATKKYIASSNDSTLGDIDEWLAKNIRAKVFVLSKLEKIGRGEMQQHIREVDSAMVVGERVRQLDRISDKIKEGLKKDGYAEGSYLLLQEDVAVEEKPEGNKGAGTIMMGLGVFFLWRIYRKKKVVA